MPASVNLCHSLVSSCVKLERTWRKENCCTACNSKHQRVLQCIVTGIWVRDSTRLRDNRVGGGIGVRVDKTIADGSVYHRNVLRPCSDLNNGECVARNNVLCPGYSTRSWVVGAAVISGAINVSCVLWVTSVMATSRAVLVVLEAAHENEPRLAVPSCHGR